VNRERRNLLVQSLSAASLTLAPHASAQSTSLFAGFKTEDIKTSGATIRTLHKGSGPPLLLLHGFPQTHTIWHQIAPRLAQDFTVVLTDLRGYGDSSKPPGGEDHAAYSKRAMAVDQIEVMRALGFDRFAVAAHDRGARVAWRLAVEHPAVVTKLAVLDIVPLPYSMMSKEFATEYWHWFFLIQPEPAPETLIRNSAEFFLRSFLPDATSKEAYKEYWRCFSNPATIHAMCEDYRAGASIDLEHAKADGGKKVECPTLVLWGQRSTVGRLYDVMKIWREHAASVQGKALPSGHFLPEEAPQETLAELLTFLK
jgi:haloacetate dehalogenase